MTVDKGEKSSYVSCEKNLY